MESDVVAAVELQPMESVVPNLPGQASRVYADADSVLGQAPLASKNDARIAPPEEAVGVPLLFGKIKRPGKWCGGQRQGDNRRSSLRNLETIYPMHVALIQALVELDGIETHQEMLQRGLVRAWIHAMSGRIIFISHEWLGWNHADPNGEQFQALKRILQRLMRGEVPKVESFWYQQAWLKQNTVVDASQWKFALLHMFQTCH